MEPRRRTTALESPPQSPQGAAQHINPRTLLAEITGYSGYREGGVRHLRPDGLTEAWVKRSGTLRPVLVPAAAAAGEGAAPAARTAAAEACAAAVGVRLPPGGAAALTPDGVAGGMGAATLAATFDCATQRAGPAWMLHQWALYMDARRPGSPGAASPPGGRAAPAADEEADSAAALRQRRTAELGLRAGTAEMRRRLLELPPVAGEGTGWDGALAPPAALAAADLVARAWPAGAPNRPATAAAVAMAPAGAVRDWAAPPGGAARWVHLVSGRRTYALLPPTRRNLTVYEAWASGPRRAGGAGLAARCEGAVRAQLGPGDTLLVPPGWLAATATAAPTVELCGSFLRADALPAHLAAARMEERLRLPPERRFPAFKQAIWHAAAHLTASLEAGAPAPPAAAALEARAAALRQEAAAVQRAAAAAAAAAAAEATAAEAAREAARGRRARGGGAPAAKRRRRSPRDSFITGGSDDSAGGGSSGEEEAWAPGADSEGTGGSGSESDSGASGGGAVGQARNYRRAALGLPARRRRGASPGAAAPWRDAAAADGSPGRQPQQPHAATRHAGRVPSRLAAMLDEDGGSEEGAGVEAEAPDEPAAAPWRAAEAAPAAPPLKLKLQLRPSGGSNIPQYDGAGDADGDGGGGGPDPYGGLPDELAAMYAALNAEAAAAAGADTVASDDDVDAPAPAARRPGSAAAGAPPPPRELSEEERDALPALLAELRRWAAAPDALHDLPVVLRDPFVTVARLELAMRAAGVSLEPPEEDEVPPPDAAEPAPPPAPREVSPPPAQPAAPGDAAAAAAADVVEESLGPKGRPPPAGAGAAGAAGGRGAGAAGAGRGRGRALPSVKARLLAKLGGKRGR